MEPQQEGITRALTPGEVNLARSVFGSTIFYQTVLVHCDSYLPFGLQNQYTAMSPNGELYFRRSLYERDYASQDPEAQHLFIHEMVHVWQHQKGMWVRARGLLSWAVSYQYRLDKPLLRHYSFIEITVLQHCPNLADKVPVNSALTVPVFILSK
ncbi:hypothetical protein [Serratia marcescens]|uniref:hypothetical protein n=1 Tax=Serratia marcescens TaxID=615 RepID=UPI000B973F11|nr:hypothetical protein [Serratia marcescens]OYO91501.1 hypothetical protein CHR63_26255 [Serratia marcescens]